MGRPLGRDGHAGYGSQRSRGAGSALGSWGREDQLRARTVLLNDERGA